MSTLIFPELKLSQHQNIPSVLYDRSAVLVSCQLSTPTTSVMTLETLKAIPLPQQKPSSILFYLPIYVQQSRSK